MVSASTGFLVQVSEQCARNFSTKPRRWIVTRTAVNLANAACRLAGGATPRNQSRAPWFANPAGQAAHVGIVGPSKTGLCQDILNA